MDYHESALTEDLAAFLRSARSGLMWTQERSAQTASVSQATISRWEKGEGIEPLAYAVSLARESAPARAELLRLIGMSGFIDAFSDMADMTSEMARRVAQLEREVRQTQERPD